MKVIQHPIGIVGAGISGLMAAKALQAEGYPVVVLEKSRALGGRLATRRLRSTVLDHGAQYFTARDPRFLAHLKEWEAQQVVSRWFQKPVGEAGLSEPAYVGAQGMTAIGKHLAADLDVRQSAKVIRIQPHTDPYTAPGWQVMLESDESLTVSSLILTAPLPQVQDILAASAMTPPVEAQAIMAPVQYDPCVVLLLCLDRPVALPNIAGFWKPEAHDPLGWVAENHRKGISPKGYGLTVQMSPAASLQWFERSDVDCYECLKDSVAPYLGDAQILEWQVKRWRYALVRNASSQQCLWIHQSPPLILAGDAFAGPRVEGAALSGLAAADQLRPWLSPAMVTEEHGV